MDQDEGQADVSLLLSALNGIELTRCRYYHLFTTLYATSLLFSEYNMTNSSWTQAHILSLINKGRQSLLASLLLVDEASVERDLKSGKGSKAKCEIVYPPCDTGVLVGLKLDQRANELVSLAQFRCVPRLSHTVQILAWSGRAD